MGGVEPPAPGRRLGGRYRIDAPLARGGMATVWRAHDELLGRAVACKTLLPELTHDEALRSRFRQEAVAAAGIEHPNVVSVYDTGEDDGTAFIVMELVEGESLRERLDRVGALDPAAAGAIAGQVAIALAHAHAQGVVHRDVKPANVLLGRDGAVKVTDFGIAKATGSADLTRTGTVVGTARYLSPEQVQGLPTDARTDVYALGLVLYEMLAGRPAYAGDTEFATAVARLAAPPADLTRVRPEVPAPLAAVVAAALQPDAAHRIPDAATFAELLRRAAAGVAPPPAPPGPVGPPPGSPPASPPGSPPRGAAGRRPAAPVRGRRGPGRVVRVVAFLVFLAVLGVAAGLVTARIVGDDGPGPVDGAAGAPAIVEVRDYDPDGDGAENPAAVDRAVDGDPATAWSSETYATRDLGGIKAGVGLVVTLRDPTPVSEVALDGAAGTDVEIRVADTAPATLSGWGPVRGRGTDLAADARIGVDPAATGRVVLVWFTRTSPSGRIDVREVRVG